MEESYWLCSRHVLSGQVTDGTKRVAKAVSRRTLKGWSPIVIWEEKFEGKSLVESDEENEERRERDARVFI